MQRITDKIYIGDREDAISQASSGYVDLILYLGQEIPEKLCFKCTPTCVHLPLKDEPNGLLKIRKVLFLAYIASTLNEKMLIACRAGISRSVLVTASLYALTQKVSFNDAYQHLKRVRQQSYPELGLMREVRQVTEELRCCI